MPWTVYVLVSENGPKTYVGISTDVSRRVDQHNGLLPSGAKSTRSGQPWTLAAEYGPYDTRSEAQKVEARVKRLRGRARLAWKAEADSGHEGSGQGVGEVEA